MSDDARSAAPAWNEARALLRRQEPAFDELEPGGPLMLALTDEWMLEVTPDGRVICQTGMAMEDVHSLLSDGTAEDLGSDELAKQARNYLLPIVAKVRRHFLAAGFEEVSEMNADYVAILFQRPVDFADVRAVGEAVQWCKAQVGR